MTDPEIRYILLKHIDRLALNREHATYLIEVIRNYTLSRETKDCLGIDDLRSLQGKVDNKSLVIFTDNDEGSIDELSSINFSILLYGISKDVHILNTLIQMLTDCLYSVFSKSLFGLMNEEQIFDAKRTLKELAFVSIAKFYKSKESVDTILSWGEKIGILKGVTQIDKIFMEKAFKLPTVCAQWQDFIYHHVFKRTVPEGSINITLQRKEIIVLCRTFGSLLTNIRSECTLNGVRALYQLLDEFMIRKGELSRVSKRYISLKNMMPIHSGMYIAILKTMIKLEEAQ